MKLRNLIWLLAILILGIGANSLNLFSQGTDLGTIRGTVTDSSGAVLPDAQVEITDLATLISYRVTTNDHGDFQALPCEVAATRPQSRRLDLAQLSSMESF